MKLLKLIVFFFIIHFIRRFFQMYKALKAAQVDQQNQMKKNPKSTDAIETEYKVL